MAAGGGEPVPSPMNAEREYPGIDVSRDAQSSRQSFSAVVLAGGASSRMGSDKAWIEVGGVPLVRRQLDIVREAGASEVFLSGRAGVDYRGLDVPVLLDARPGMGPLAGVQRALDRTIASCSSAPGAGSGFPPAAGRRHRCWHGQAVAISAAHAKSHRPFGQLPALLALITASRTIAGGSAPVDSRGCQSAGRRAVLNRSGSTNKSAGLVISHSAAKRFRAAVGSTNRARCTRQSSRNSSGGLS